MAEAPLVCTKTNLNFRLEAEAFEGQASGVEERRGRDPRRPQEAARADAEPGRAVDRGGEEARGRAPRPGSGLEVAWRLGRSRGRGVEGGGVLRPGQGTASGGPCGRGGSMALGSHVPALG